MKHCVDSTLLVSGTGLSLLRISLGLKTDRIENANQRVRCQICHSKKSTINLVNQTRNKLNSLTDKSSYIMTYKNDIYFKLENEKRRRRAKKWGFDTNI